MRLQSLHACRQPTCICQQSIARLVSVCSHLSDKHLLDPNPHHLVRQASRFCLFGKVGRQIFSLDPVVRHASCTCLLSIFSIRTESRPIDRESIFVVPTSVFAMFFRSGRLSDAHQQPTRDHLQPRNIDPACLQPLCLTSIFPIPTRPFRSDRS
jgi:hypothetical protein